MLLGLFHTYLNFLVVSIVSIFAYKNYILASKSDSNERYIGIILLTLLLFAISLFFGVHGLLKIKFLNLENHAVPILALSFISIMQIMVFVSTYKRLTLSK